ncbi:MAG TPA: transcription termination/antitermination protein NusA [Rhodospirillaceae bacterium]|jgi:N utilization substance protein A|nr:transcription termination/antitermination protein NusA [Alphaproteobacteria bacterium]HBH26557.1 transcription termination/antitermination protein NusA [Rhodospirillaceae bacterium]
MELLQNIETGAREKGLDPAIFIAAAEKAVVRAARAKYGQDHDIRATLDRKTGRFVLKRYREVMADPADIENDTAQITIEQARRIKGDAQAGEFIVDDLPPMDFGRIAAGAAKQTIIQTIRDAERAKQYAEFKDRVGEIVSGVVKRIEYGNATVDIAQGKAEALLRRDENIPREFLNIGDRVRAVIYDVREELRGPQIFLSRTHPEFLAKLFMQEVPEIYDGIIEIKGVARDPGSRAKIAVLSHDYAIDPVGACVGMRGSRVQAVVGELGGEKIDIIPWTQDIATFIVHALQPAVVTKVVLDEQTRRMDVVVPEDQLSLAIGRRGQNVRLASMLSGWDIDLMTEAEESERRQAEMAQRSALFMEALDVDDVLAQLLVVEGFTSVEDVAETTLAELCGIEGFDEDIATELQNRAATWLEAKAKERAEKRAALGLAEDLIAFDGGLTEDQIIRLGEQGLKTLDDLADLAGDELREMLREGEGEEAQDVLTGDEANAVIMAARAHWFPPEEEDAEAEAGPAEQQ